MVAGESPESSIGSGHPRRESRAAPHGGSRRNLLHPDRRSSGLRFLALLSSSTNRSAISILDLICRHVVARVAYVG